MQNPNEDTEWNDQLRKHGILPEKPPSPTAELEAALEEAVEKAHANRLEGRTLDELDELEEDGLEDEEFVQQYRDKRMREIREQASRERFGEVIHIYKAEYTEAVTDASKDFPVVLHVSSQRQQSRLLSGLLLRIAPRFKDIKFVDIDCHQINDRYPEDRTPTILVYKNGNVIKQQVTLEGIGGNSCNVKDIDTFLVKCGVVERTDPRLLDNKDDSESDYSD